MTAYPGARPFTGELVVTREATGSDGMVKRHAEGMLHDMIREQGWTPIPGEPVKMVERTPILRGWAADGRDMECGETDANAFRLTWQTRALPPTNDLRARLTGLHPDMTVLLQHGDGGPVTTTTAGALIEDLDLVAGSPVPGMLRDAFDAAMRSVGSSRTLYDQPSDPLAAMREMADRIARAQAAATVLVTGEPLGFDVPALAGREVRRAGVDVTFGADDMFRWSTVVPPVGWSAGWVAGPGALDTARALMASTLASARLPEPQPAVNMLTALPVWESDDAPAGALIPVVVRAVDR